MERMLSPARALVRPVLWCAVLAVLAPAAARGDAKYTRKTREISVKQTDATKKLEAKPKDKEKEPAPALTADDFFQIESAVQDIRDEQLGVLKDLIGDTEPDDPERADLLFRLAELLAQKQRHYHFLAMDALNKADTSKKPADKKKYQQAHKKHLAEEQKWLKEAVKVYQAIADNPKFKGYARMDEALFYYAYTLSQAKYDDLARKVYYRLIKDYPNSKYIPDAYLSFAEDFFKKNDLENANKFYDKVLQFPKSGVYIYAVYMKGWVYYNQGNPQASLETWYKVAEATKNNKRQGALNRASKKDFVRAYADVGKPELAYKAFQRVDTEYAFTMLSMLGELYLAQGKAEKTIFVYRQLIALNEELKKNDKRICEWQYTIVRAMMTVGSPTEKVKEIERLLKFQKHLADNKIIPEGNLTECAENGEATTGELAKVWHTEGLKTLNYETLGYAGMLYKLFLEYFPDSAEAPDMQAWFAELAWKRAENEKNPSMAALRWEEAAIEFQKVVQMNKVEPKLVKEAAYATVLAWKNALAVDIATDPPSTNDKPGEVKPMEIPEKEQKMLAAFDVYIKYVTDPKDEELISIKFLKGRTYWKYKHFEECVPYFEDIIKTRPDHETAEFSARLLRDALAQLGRTEELVAWVDKMLGSPKLLEGRDELVEELKRDKRLSEGKLAEAFEKQGRYKECGEQYLMIFNKYLSGKTEGQGSDDLAKILYNAGSCFEKANLLGQAIQMREELIKRFYDPKSQDRKSVRYELSSKAQFALGFNYAQIAGPYYEKAAERFEEYARKFGGEKNAVDALKNAYFFRKGLGQDKEAIDDIESFIKQYAAKNPKEAAAADYSLADIFEKRKDWDGTVKKLNAYLKRWGAKGGVDRQIAANVRIGEILWRQSCPVKTVNGACLEIKRERALKTKRQKRSKVATQCGPEWKTKIRVIDRKPAFVKQAQAHFNTALKLWKGGDAAKDIPGEDEGDKAVRASATIYWVAAANFYLGEDKYEEFLTVKFPENLEFDDQRPKKKKDSEARFKKWLGDKQKTLQASQAIYMHVVNDIKGGGAHWAIASAARVGQLFQNFADALFTAPIPPMPDELKTLARQAGMPIDEMQQTFADTYCDTLMSEADPLEQKSIEAFSFCLDTSLALNWSNEWSRLCEGELSQIRPQDFPSAGEIRAAADGVPLTLDVQPIAQELDLGAKPGAQ